MANQLAFYFDASACTGCKACQIACQDKNQLSKDVLWRRVISYSGGGWNVQEGFWFPNNVFSYAVSTACNHCQDPVCTKVCPTTAITKREDGIVLIDDSKCIGCRYCAWACPYAAPDFDEDTGKMTKCTFCSDYIDAGQPPACVAACPSRALNFGELSDLRTKYGSENEIAPLPPANLTEPSLVLTPSPKAEQTKTGTGKLANPEEV
jgi:anaerobic dimethyl sulfoxide reductase subunit B (iron-sulfur subunit)